MRLEDFGLYRIKVARLNVPPASASGSESEELTPATANVFSFRNWQSTCGGS